MSRTAVLKELADRMDELVDSVPTNQQTGEPRAYVDPSTVTEELNEEYHYKVTTGNSKTNGLKEVNESNSLKVLEKATVPLDYSEGYPTVDGYPFWERLDGEPENYYQMFKHYRDTPLRGEKRAFAKTARQFDEKPEIMSALARVYQWQQRVKAFDKKRDLEREMQRAHYIKELEGDHYDAATKIFEKCMEYFNKNSKAMKPSVALKWFKTAIELSRLSLGLSPDKPDAEAVKNLQQTLVQINNTPDNSKNTINAVAQSGQAKDDREQEAEHMQEVIDILADTGLLPDSEKSDDKITDINTERGNLTGPNGGETDDDN